MYKVTKVKAYPYSDNVVEVSEYSYYSLQRNDPWIILCYVCQPNLQVEVGDQVEIRQMNDGTFEISHVYPRRK